MLYSPQFVVVLLFLLLVVTENWDEDAGGHFQLVTYTGYSNSIFSSGHPKHHTKVDTYSLLNYTSRIKRNTEEHIHRAVSVPALPPSSLDGCGIIDISYFVEVLAALWVCLGTCLCVARGCSFFLCSVSVMLQKIIGPVAAGKSALSLSLPSGARKSAVSLSLPTGAPNFVLKAPPSYCGGVGIAQWLERRTHD